MIWVKTDAGRIEMQARSQVKDRARRNLLLLIDGNKSDELLLSGLAGVTAADFEALHQLGLIRPAAAESGGTGKPAGSEVSLGTGMPPSAPPALSPADLNYGQFTAVLTELISAHLGLRGFTLSLAVEKASTPEELQNVGRRVLDMLRERKGDALADAARARLFGA